MSVTRLKLVPPLTIDRVAADSKGDPEVLRLENLDTDLRPPASALVATRLSIDDDDANSYLPFLGQENLRKAVVDHLHELSGIQYDRTSECVITAGGTAGILNVLLAMVNPGDEIILTDPTYVGLTARVLLAGGVPRFVPYVVRSGAWRLDVESLRNVISDRTRALLIMNPSMPSGAVLNRAEWKAIAEICASRSLWLIYNAAMERILYDGREYLHPVSLPDMAERTITVGSASKEYRMIGWRVGWVVGPQSIMADVARVSIYNVVTPVGLAQQAAAAAIQSPKAEFDAALGEWQRRRDTIVDELRSAPVINAAGGWSMLLDVHAMGYDSFEASRRLLERGKVAATPMRDWGPQNGDRFVRLVFSNEPAQRLAGIGERVRRSLM